jgi:hypothetical protein
MNYGDKGNKGNKGNKRNKGATEKPAALRDQRPRHAGQRNDGPPASRNVVASVAVRLLRLAHEREEEYQLVLMRYCARSQHAPTAPAHRRELRRTWPVSRRGSPDRADAGARSRR